MIMPYIREMIKKKKWLMPDAEISAAEVVLCEELAGRAEAANLFH